VAHPLRSLARSGATMVFGSDWPVSPWDPEAVLAGAVDGARGEEALGADEAVAWYTSTPPCPTKSSSKGSSSTASTA
jgi:predicted amidohydrolase YtcJ